MKIRHLAAMAFGLVFLTSCTITKDQYEAGQTVVQGSKSARRELTKVCNALKPTATELKSMALVLDTTEAKVKSVLCPRVVNAIASGRLTYEDYINVAHGKVTPKIVKIFQGR